MMTRCGASFSLQRRLQAAFSRQAGHRLKPMLQAKARATSCILAAVFFAGAALAQHYEVGATVGYGIYHDGTIFSASGTADAGIRNRFATGILLGDEFSKYVSAEFDYLYHDGHPFLQAPGVKTDIQGNSDALTIQLLFHFKTREHRWRPFLAGGAGAKEYVIAGPAPFPQPIPEIASLTTNDV